MIGNRYRIDALLGRGGMGVAYAATNVVTGKQIALKWILREGDAGRLQRVIREARAAGRVRHPNIVDVYDVGEHDGSLFLVMELLSGQSLQALIEQRGPLPSGELLSLLLPALRGVRAAHRCGVIHRDLKPANIFLCRDDAGEPLTAKVLDFGVSKIVTDTVDGEDPSLTDSGAVLGTPSYAAPEQLEHARRADPRADVYACGAILYHALSGRRPFEAASYAKLVVEVMTGQPVPLTRLRPDLSPALCAIVERALQRDPAHRFADMDELIAALEALDRPAGVGPPRVPAGAGAAGGLQLRTRGRRTLLGLAALILIALGTWWSRIAATDRDAAAGAAQPRPPAAIVAAERAAGAEPIAAPAPVSAPAPVGSAQAGVAEVVGQPALARPSRAARPGREPRVPPSPPAAASARPRSAEARPDGIIELSSDDF